MTSMTRRRCRTYNPLRQMLSLIHLTLQTCPFQAYRSKSRAATLLTYAAAHAGFILAVDSKHFVLQRRSD